MTPPQQAFILCGGLGTRLRSVVADRPKSMAPVAGRPFLERQVLSLKRQGVHRFVLGTGYLGEMVESHFGDGSRFDLCVQYSHETTPLGTGGALKLALPLLEEHFLCLNGDSYVEFSLAEMTHALGRYPFVMALREVSDASRYGQVEWDPEGTITAFREKSETPGPGWINAGVYCIRREILGRIPDHVAFSLERELLPQLTKGELGGVPGHGVFIDIGLPDDYEKAQSWLTDSQTL